ncbi:kinase [Actinoalloteichus sp. AHMU CJ021]|uniref:Threonine kinase n=1 Tax=Actinoalloteichus caeruleus DSM 43889 TaxID=1120930 RepID=A0ABT1JEI9_ACTCY|nr:kinase [Actinoalloteichus caeruleus]AUS79780.1 kinase [Actinoalloteichus sp. AHMU CJ021]MCP2330583.1 threonine kinase (EC 2.7.1.-) [Actinoalloteichus caeruleus DSM 43889]
MTADRSTTTRTGVGAAYGTFGELLQGVLPERDGDFLVTLPIGQRSTATFSLGDHDELAVQPAGKWKSARMAGLVLAAAGLPPRGLLVIGSDLPEGKGLASSSADLVATARAVGRALGTRLSTREVEAFLRRIEPTDGVLYRDVVAYHHRSARLRGRLGQLPPATIVAIDEGGQVDTVAFNQLPKPYSASDQREYAMLLDRLRVAMRRGDLKEVGSISTRSAELNQRLRPKRTFEQMRSACAEVGGLGVVVAHSGTMIGVMLDESDPDFTEKWRALRRSEPLCAGSPVSFRSLRSSS